MKRAFTRSLATVLSVLMILTCSTALFTIFASADAPSFDWADSWTTVDGTTVGGWQSATAPAAGQEFTYDYAAEMAANGDIYVGVKFYGTLSGTSASYGNGNGTNIRLWFRSASSGYISYQYLLDVAYDGTTYQTRMNHNSNASGNTSSALYTYTDTKPYTMNAASVTGGMEAEVIIPASVMNLGENCEIIVTVSNNVTTNYALFNTTGTNAASSWDSLTCAKVHTVWGTDKTLVDGTSFGTWQTALNEGDDDFQYTVNYSYDSTNAYIEIDFNGPFAGTAASYGNGVGTLMRIWFYDSAKTIEVDGVATACTLYTSFIDIAYAGESGILNRFLVNTLPTTNKASVVAGCDFTDADSGKPYTVSNVYDATAGTWVMKLTMPLTSVCGDVANLEFQPNVATIINDANNALYYGATKNPYQVWTSTSALPHVPQFPEAGNAILSGTNLVKENVNLGSTQLDYLTSDGVANYANSMNDGITADPTEAFSYGYPWYAFYINGAKYTIDPTTHTGKATFDLGSAKAISEVSMQVAPSIGTASSIKAYASVNNMDWLEVATLTYDGTAIQTISTVLANEITARYWKFEFVTDGMFFMVSEIMIYEYNLAQKANIGSINAYDWGTNYPVILAYGNGSTPVATVGGAWFSYWYKVKAAWSQADHAFIVNAVDAPGSAAYADWVMGEKEFVLLSYGENVDAASKIAVWDLVVGDKLYAYGFNFSNASANNLSTVTDGVYSSNVYLYTHSAVETGYYDISDVTYPGYFTENVIPEYTTATNLATGATLGGDACGNATYCGNIIDGVAPATGYTSTWRAYTKGTSSSIIDLGAERSDLGSVSVWMWPANKSGIVKPDSVKFYASIDGFGWLEIGELDMSDSWFSASGDTARWVDLKFANYLDARYIKMEVKTSGNFSFIGEVAVNALAEIPTHYFTTTYEYTNSSINLISYKMGDILDDCNANLKTHAWWNFATVAWDVTAQAYKVTGTYLGDGTGDYGDLAIPEYGFLIGSHASGTAEAIAFAQFIAQLNVGDNLYLYGADLEQLTATGTALTTALVSESAISGLTAYAPDVMPLLTSVGFRTGDVSLFVRVMNGATELTTIDEIAAFIRGVEVGDATDYNYYGLIVVDSNNVVTSVNYGLGRPTYDKGATVVPEGGYAIAINSGNAFWSRFQQICVGETVTLIGVDLTALRANTGAVIVADDPETTEVDESSVTASTIDLTGAYFGVEHAHAWGETIVVAPTCTEDGYSYHECSICGEVENIEDSVVPATGHVSDGIVHVKEPTCVDEGYSYYLCTVDGAEMIIEGTTVPATGHTYVETTVGKFTKHTCSVCGEYYYTDAAGNAAGDIKVSHLNTYNWGTFEAMIITGDGKTVKQVINQSPVWWIVYVVENIDGNYVATSYYKNVAEVNTVTVPTGGYLLYIYSANNAYTAYGNGELVGSYLMADNFTISTSAWGIDTVASPSLTKHIYAITVPNADYTAYNASRDSAAALTETDYTAESWAALQAALAVDVSGKKDYDQSVVDSATQAINAAILALEAAAPAVVTGDLNGDGIFNGDDIILARQADVSMVTLTTEQRLAGDVNGDGEFNGDDVILMVQMDVSIISAWPAN